jgi:hypothetical protein
MKKQELKPGQIVQLDPNGARNRMFAGCFMVVTEPKEFGAQGYIQSIGINENPGGQAYYRATWDEMGLTSGNAGWVVS